LGTLAGGDSAEPAHRLEAPPTPDATGEPVPDVLVSRLVVCDVCGLVQVAPAPPACPACGSGRVG